MGTKNVKHRTHVEHKHPLPCIRSHQGWSFRILQKERNHWKMIGTFGVIHPLEAYFQIKAEFLVKLIIE